MKSLITALVVTCAALLPVTQVEAAPPGKTTEFAAKKFGGFKPGTKFNFKVSKLISSKASLLGVTKECPVPPGIPKMKVGQKVNFIIGKKGELKGPGFSINFRSESGLANVYVNTPKKGSTVQADTATVYKDSKGKAMGVALSFFATKGSGFNTDIHSVYYTF